MFTGAYPDVRLRIYMSVLQWKRREKRRRTVCQNQTPSSLGPYRERLGPGNVREGISLGDTLRLVRM